MNNKKAIEILSQIRRESEGCLRLNLDEKTREIYENQLSASNLAIKALEKQIRKKSIEIFYEERDGEDWYETGIYHRCPHCDHLVGKYINEIDEFIYQETHCDDCGQRLNWED